MLSSVLNDSSIAYTALVLSISLFKILKKTVLFIFLEAQKACYSKPDLTCNSQYLACNMQKIVQATLEVRQICMQKT
jgi:hypothetical protein